MAFDSIEDGLALFGAQDIVEPREIEVQCSEEGIGDQVVGGSTERWRFDADSDEVEVA